MIKLAVVIHRTNKKLICDPVNIFALTANRDDAVPILVPCSIPYPATIFIDCNAVKRDFCQYFHGALLGGRHPQRGQ